MATYNIPKELKSTTRMTKHINVSDWFFGIGWVSVSLLLRSAVHDRLVLPFIIFFNFMGFLLILPSGLNKKRKLYQSIILLLRKDKKLYKPLRIKLKGVNKQ